MNGEKEPIMKYIVDGDLVLSQPPTGPLAAQILCRCRHKTHWTPHKSVVEVSPRFCGTKASRRGASPPPFTRTLGQRTTGRQDRLAIANDLTTSAGCLSGIARKLAR